MNAKKERGVSIHDEIGSDMAHIGGLLRCTECSTEQPLGSIGTKLRTGWPKCCGYTMRWVTARQLAAEGKGHS